VSPSTQFHKIADETCKTLKLPPGSVEMMIGESEVNEYRTMSEMDIKSGIRLKCRMNVIWKIFVSKEKLTVEKISEGLKYVEKVLFSTVERIMSQGMFPEIKKKISENEKNEEIYSSLISLLKMILYRAAGMESGYGGNFFSYEMKESDLFEMIENKVKEIVVDERKKNSEMNECERDMILEYSFLMKNDEIEKELLKKLWKCLILIVQDGISKEKKKEEIEGLIGLRCICEWWSFFLSSFSLFLFHFSIDFYFSSFYFIIFIGNQGVLRNTSVVSEVKERREEYEKEVEGREKGEIEKRKLDKISFVCLLQIEFLLVKEEEEKKRFVKNNILPVLPFLLCGEEKEKEEEDSDGDHVENAIVFQFLCDYLLENDSLRSLLLSDERNLLLNKTLLFSLRRDSPFTRTLCLHVLYLLFHYGREEEMKLVMREGGMKCVVLKMREKEEREKDVKEKGKEALRRCLCRDPYGNRIPYRKKEGWKWKEIMREIMWMMEEEDVKETLIMSYPHGIYYFDVPSFNYGLGMCLHAR
jgi:hypothetical protein